MKGIIKNFISYSNFNRLKLGRPGKYFRFLSTGWRKKKLNFFFFFAKFRSQNSIFWSRSLKGWSFCLKIAVIWHGYVKCKFCIVKTQSRKSFKRKFFIFFNKISFRNIIYTYTKKLASFGRLLPKRSSSQFLSALCLAGQTNG